MIETILLSSLIICMVQYYVYATNVVWEYLSLLTHFFKGNQSQKLLHGIMMIGPAKKEEHYLSFLNKVYDNFIIRLISCPICTGFWMSVIASVVIGNILLFAPIAYISLCLYFLIKILTNKSNTI